MAFETQGLGVGEVTTSNVNSDSVIPSIASGDLYSNYISNLVKINVSAIIKKEAVKFTASFILASILLYTT
jgi:hypothetical protein